LCARTKRRPPEPAPLARSIVHVGETERNFKTRWNEYVRWIPIAWRIPLNEIWFAALPVWIGAVDAENPNEPKTRWLRLYIERRLIWDLHRAGRQLFNVD
jgi:hypothetical protein